MFLLRILIAVEKNYWSTKLEIAGFVWTIKKVRHLVKSSKHPVIIQIDYSAILDIIKQSSITSTTSTMRINIRLIRAFQFLRLFRLDVRHKPDKEHIVPDTLSRLASSGKSSLPDNHSELDVLYTQATQALGPCESLHSYSATLIEIDEAFRDRLLQSYITDSHWHRIETMIDDNASHVVNGESADLPFVRGSIELIFHRNKFIGLERLYIPQALIKDILEIAHNNNYPDFERSFNTVFKS